MQGDRKDKIPAPKAAKKGKLNIGYFNLLIIKEAMMPTILMIIPEIIILMTTRISFKIMSR